MASLHFYILDNTYNVCMHVSFAGVVHVNTVSTEKRGTNPGHRVASGFELCSVAGH